MSSSSESASLPAKTDELEHQLVTSPLLNFAAITHNPNAFPSRGLLGWADANEKIYLNTNTPSCGIICGVQGSGKSHTVSCILEACLISDSKIGALPQPLAACVFHFDKQGYNRPGEAVFLSLPGSENASQEQRNRLPPITVLCSPSNISRRRHTYSALTRVRVEALYFSEQNLTVERMLTIMGCDETQNLPLYMQSVLNVIRNFMGKNEFNYRDFKTEIKALKLDAKQRKLVDLRLDLLDGFLHPEAPTVQSYFRPGRLVLVDLTDPFLDGKRAAIIFDLVLELFTEWQTTTGKIIVLDEAHKYLTDGILTHSIMNIIRQQRHLAMRVIISTQEPTVIPSHALDLASFIFCHRFTSPSWCTHLARHVAVAGDKKAQWFEDVLLLPTGRCIVFSPSALIMKSNSSSAQMLGQGYLNLRVRPRLTLDGGTSLLVVGKSGRSTMDDRASIVDSPPRVPRTLLAHALSSLQSNTNTYTMPRRGTGTTTSNWEAPIASSSRTRFVSPARSTPSISGPKSPTISSAVIPRAATNNGEGSTSKPKAVSKRFKHLIKYLQRKDGVNVPIDVNLAIAGVALRESKSKMHLDKKEKESLYMLFEEAEAIGLVELGVRDSRRTIEGHKAVDKKRTIRLLHSGPFKWK